MDPLNPPAHVREHVDLAALCILGSKQAETMKRNDRINVEARLVFARTLAKIRHNMNDGRWGGYLRQIEVSSEKASQLLRAAQIPEDKADLCGSWQEVLAIITAHQKGSNSGGGRNKGRGGRKKQEAKQADSEKPQDGTQSEPGEDWEEDDKKAQDKAKGKNGREVYDWKSFEKVFAPIPKAVDELAKYAGILNTPRQEGLRRLLKEVLAEAKAVYAEAQKTNGKE